MIKLFYKLLQLNFLILKLYSKVNKERKKHILEKADVDIKDFKDVIKGVDLEEELVRME